MENAEKNKINLFKTLFYKFPENLLACFRLHVLPLHLLAFVLTWLLVNSEFDWKYYIATQNSNFKFIFFPALFLGGILPILIPFFLYIYGKNNKNTNLIRIAGTLGQAALLGLLISFFYKALTGRAEPDFYSSNILADLSHGFRFGLLRGGVFWGWPSSHTTIAFSMATALIAFFPKNRKVFFFALLWAFYVGIGVATVGIHWFSEFIAGAIFGSLTGTIVGRSYYWHKISSLAQQ